MACRSGIVNLLRRLPHANHRSDRNDAADKRATQQRTNPDWERIESRATQQKLIDSPGEISEGQQKTRHSYSDLQDYQEFLCALQEPACVRC